MDQACSLTACLPAYLLVQVVVVIDELHRV